MLSGGNTAEVVRAGDRLIRTGGPWVPAVNALLSTLRRAGIEQVPEPFGVDDRGRQVVSYLPGQVPHYPLPPWVWSEKTLREAARLVRRIHDASVPLLTQDLPWRAATVEPVEVIGHGDIAPYNMVFDVSDDGAEATLIGLFDFDFAAPVPRLWDLAYLGYRMAPLITDGGGGAPTDWRRRLRVMLDAYGSDAHLPELLAMTSTRLHRLAEFSEDLSRQTGRADLADHAAMYRRDAARIASYIAADAKD